MRHTRSALLLLSLLLLATAAATQGICPPAGSLSFPVTLTGSGGSGGGFFTLNPGNNTATLQLNAVGLSPNVTAVTLNNGGISFPFFTTGQTGGFDANGNFVSTIPLTQQQLNAILANPSAWTVNVATGEMPGGALSGTVVNATTLSGTFSGIDTSTAGGSFSATIAPNVGSTGATLFYTFTPTGIGTTFTGLSLNQGTGGTQFLNLSNGGTLTNGRFTGSVPLTDAQTQALLTNPSNFNVTATTTQFPSGAVRAQLGLTPFELWFPVAGRVRGALGNQWTTDVSIYNNASTVPATVTIEVFPAGQTNTTSGGTMSAASVSTLTVPAHSTTAISNVASTLASFSGLGALRITSNQPIVAVERIYDANSSAIAGGLAAQPILARTPCDALARGVLVGLMNTAGVRTNVGFFNPNPVTATVQINQNGTQTLTLPPYQLVQMPVNGDVTDGALTYSSTAPLLAYSSVVSNGTGDSHVAFARPDLSVPATPLADVAAIAIAANQAELADVQMVLSHPGGSSPQILTYVVRMLNDHGAALSAETGAFAAAGVTPSTNNPTAKLIQSQNQQEIATLTPMQGLAFNRAFLQAQVADHQKLLQLLDTVLIPSAGGSTPLVQSTLLQLREITAQHLADAQALLAQQP